MNYNNELKKALELLAKHYDDKYEELVLWIADECWEFTIAHFWTNRMLGDTKIYINLWDCTVEADCARFDLPIILREYKNLLQLNEEVLEKLGTPLGAYFTEDTEALTQDILEAGIRQERRYAI